MPGRNNNECEDGEDDKVGRVEAVDGAPRTALGGWVGGWEASKTCPPQLLKDNQHLFSELPAAKPEGEF